MKKVVKQRPMQSRMPMTRYYAMRGRGRTYEHVAALTAALAGGRRILHDTDVVDDVHDVLGIRLLGSGGGAERHTDPIMAEEMMVMRRPIPARMPLEIKNHFEYLLSRGRRG